MARMAAFVYALIICAAMAPAYGEYYTESRNVPRKEKMTRLHFFLHDILSGKNPSAVKVAGSNRTEEGKFKGSSFSVFSRNPVTEADREVAVVGGRGKFRMAGGFAKVKTSYFNATTGDAILEYKRRKKMAKASLALLVISMVGVMQSANAESWARRLEAEKETVTKPSILLP
ncbi:hypothetical protein OIU84_009390 [Salix udensis]|uniref:Dirigent protein n=1 Tax=Salix udensis TaxID=889485 RepID=A0AAD6JRB5_9ROSI|nr:hypothetical protein OIU84_009390 [Salix udensis]